MSTNLLKTEDVLSDISAWAHEQTEGAAARGDILRYEAHSTCKTDSERMSKLEEMSELVGYCRAMVALQNYLLGVAQALKDLKESSE